MKNESERQNGNRVDPGSFHMTKGSLLTAGAALALYGVSRKSLFGAGLAAAGGILALVGSGVAVPKTHHATSSFLINCSASDAYRYWRNFENLPSFMRHLQSVRVIDDQRSEWTALGPLETPIRWTAEIEQDQRDQLICWRSLPGSDLQIRGSVEFRPAPADRGTILQASVQYELPGGTLGRAIAMVLGKNPAFAIREDLRRFKALIEASEIPTTQGQPHGRRSPLVSAMHKAYPQRIVSTEEQPELGLAASAGA